MLFDPIMAKLSVQIRALLLAFGRHLVPLFTQLTELFNPEFLHAFQGDLRFLDLDALHNGYVLKKGRKRLS